MPRFWLSEQEVAELTGKVRPSAQLRVLEKMGYAVVHRPDGTFVVPVDQFLSSGTTDNQKEWTLDFSRYRDGTKAA